MPKGASAGKAQEWCSESSQTDMAQISAAGETDKHREEISCDLRQNRREARRWVKEIELRATAIFEQALNKL